MVEHPQAQRESKVIVDDIFIVNKDRHQLGFDLRSRIFGLNVKCAENLQRVDDTRIDGPVCWVYVESLDSFDQAFEHLLRRPTCIAD